MKIFLLGLPGSGKTTLGKELSTLLNLPFVDLDLEIEKGTGKKITVIFKDHGEDHFRNLESRELEKWCLLPTGFVMATGGGTPCFLTNMELINRAGKSIFLDVSSRIIAERIKRAGLLERPLLASLHPDELKDQIEFLRSGRIRFYNKAQVVIVGDAITSDVIIKKLGD